mmetsp:Transcript_64012/g.138606  ORF Transcript_64012/g.138606 Transcript_64012/m.138606 type:complete len:229 (+) Transcript_64012:175-861(+)
MKTPMHHHSGLGIGNARVSNCFSLLLLQPHPQLALQQCHLPHDHRPLPQPLQHFVHSITRPQLFGQVSEPLDSLPKPPHPAPRHRVNPLPVTPRLPPPLHSQQLQHHFPQDNLRLNLQGSHHFILLCYHRECLRPCQLLSPPNIPQLSHPPCPVHSPPPPRRSRCSLYPPQNLQLGLRLSQPRSQLESPLLLLLASQLQHQRSLLLCILTIHITRFGKSQSYQQTGRY